jgi:hypothetical protein
METKKNKLIFDGPILPGCVTVCKNKCGKPNCACKANPPKLHGPYYRWTGVINGKRTTRTISKEVAEECQRKINNYKKLQKKIKDLLNEELQNIQWNSKKEDS